MTINYGGWQAELHEQHGIGLLLSRDTGVAAEQLSTRINDAEWLFEAGLRARKVAERDFSRDHHSRLVEARLTAIKAGKA